MGNSDNVKQTVGNFFSKNGTYILLSFLVFIFILYLSRKIQLRQQNCSTLKTMNKDFTFYTFNELRNANYFKSGPTNDYNCKLKDFYFKKQNN